MSSVAASAGGFESFPVWDKLDDSDSEQSTIASKLKRFFVGAPSSSSSSTAGPTPSLAAPIAPHSSLEPSPSSNTISALSEAPSNPPPPVARQHSRNSSATKQQLAQLVSATARPTGNPIPFPTNGASNSTQRFVPDYPTLPNGRKVVRPIRLSGVAPSVRLTVANSEKGDLVQSGSSRSIASEHHRYGMESSPMMHGSPTTSDAFGATLANLSSIPGFPLGRDAADDSRSVRSMSTVARPSASVAHVIRKLRGEGLSKEYWIKDESSKECFDCQTLFTAFRRKHHCRICGQIFCSRCASHIIPSARFGQSGYVRVCNLCLSVLEHGGDPSPIAEEPPPRARPSLRDGNSRLNISAPIEASARPPQSQFAASHLFPRSETPYNQPSELDFGRISETSSRPHTPFTDDDQRSPKRSLSGSPRDEFDDSPRPQGASPPMTTAIAPFRRALVEDDQAEGRATEGLGITTDGEPPIEEGEEGDEEAEREEEEVGDAPDAPPLTVGADEEEVALAPALPTLDEILSVTSARSLPAVETDAAAPAPLLNPIEVHKLLATKATPLQPSLDRAYSRLSSHAEPGSSNFIFQELPGVNRDPGEFPRTLTGIPSFLDHPEPLPSHDPGLSEATMLHVRKMLRQSLSRAGIPTPKAWENVLVKLLVQVAQDPAPDLHAGDNMDIRQYVRVKKIPGGHPRDSEYVNGVVFTKNVLHKQMARHLSNPRVMLFSFPLEYQRVENQLMSLEPLLTQEKEYLRNLVQRIAAQRPHVVLVQRNVSRLALEYLMENGIAVARNVKVEAINAVARATQADTISSMGELASEPRLGRCGTFRVQTFVHSLIPGKRKTFMRFEGCSKDLGCTLLLRGGSMEVLTKVKKIVDTMVLVIYNAKLEGYLFRDELLFAAPTSKEEEEGDKTTSADDGSTNLLAGLVEQNRDRISKDIARSLRPYESTALSGSPGVHFSPPYPLARMSEEDRRVTALRKLREYEETEQILHEEAVSREIISASSSTMSLQSLGSEGGTSAAGSIQSAATTLDSLVLPRPAPPPPEDSHKVLQTPEELARITEFTEAEQRHADQLVVWENYLASNHDSLDPVDHQQIFVLETQHCSQTEKLCLSPNVKSITFYGENDCSLGQYVENIVNNAGQPCEVSGCGRPGIAHYTTFVHNKYCVTIIAEAHEVESARPDLVDRIVMFTYCRECASRSAQSFMSEETYSLSFGKYLELSFYPPDLHRVDCECEHNGHLSHVRYLNLRNITLRITLEPIDLRNIVAPPRTLKIKPEKQLQLRNDEYLTVRRKSTAFWDSIAHRIASFNYDLVGIDRVDECRAAMAEMSTKCEVDRKAIARLLDTTYEQATATNGTEMTSVRRTLQNKAVDWETEWTTFEQKIIPSEKDVRRLTTVQLKRLFSNDGLPLSPERRTTSSGLAPSIEMDEKEELACKEGADCDAPTHSDCDPSISTTLSSQTQYGSLSSMSTTLSSLPSPSLPSPATEEPQSMLSNTDNESDSTVCADPPPPVNANARIPSPYVVRRQQSHHLDDTSGAESEFDQRLQQSTPSRRTRSGQGVAQLVNFFSSEQKDSLAKTLGVGLSSGSPTADKSGRNSSQGSRPAMKRGATDKPRSKGRMNTKDVLSDGDGGSYARNVGISYLPNQQTQAQSTFAEKPSRIPARKGLARSNTLARLFDPPSDGERRFYASPPSSRPTSPRASFSFNLSTSPTASRPASGRSTPLLSRGSSHDSSSITVRGGSRPTLSTNTSGQSSRSSLKGKSKDVSGRDYESSETGRSTTSKKHSSRNLGLSRPTASTINKATGRRNVSQNSIGSHRVQTITKHFDNLSRETERRFGRETERERERQRKLALFRGKRARPVAIAHPTIQVFDNVRDAAKEDSDTDEDRSSGSGSDGADDEDDDDEDIKSDAEDDGKPTTSKTRSRSPSVNHEAGREPSSASTKESFTYEPLGPPPTMLDALVQPPSEESIEPALASVDESAEVPPETTPTTPSDETGAPKVEISEAEEPSVPPSPLLNDSFPLPRMSEGESSGNERGSIIKAISNLWAYRGGDFTPLEYPLAAGEHIFADNPILVREDEPTSILAFALSSKAYRGKLEEHGAAAPRVVERSEAFMPDETHPADRSTTWGVVDFQQDGTDVEDTLRKPEAKHFRLQYEEGTTTFFCKIFFAEQFDALRRNCGCSTQFIESLARCFKWESSGGRSKVGFLKTQDDRFIAKEISRLEMDALLRFAPAYFEYMSKAIFHGLPTILAKIFGFYRIGLRNPTTGKVMRLDVLVMENLFYERKLTQVFDLKGSTRNRHVQVSTDKPHEVLMDENLVEISRTNPLYVREDSKRFIKAAIFNDSLFLSNLNVMDYSLVVGVDSVKQELVVGIVDFIRTYTWDKRLENWVKDSAFLGGGSSKPGGPTIITPKQYKTRFRDAMDAYFLLSPDPWLSPTSLLPLGPSNKEQFCDAADPKTNPAPLPQ